MHPTMTRMAIALVLAGLTAGPGFGLTPQRAKAKPKAAVRHSAKALLPRSGAEARASSKARWNVASAHSPISHLRSTRASRISRLRIFFNPWTEPTFADSTLGDRVDGEDLIVRRAAVQALGPYNGTVVAVEPQTGRILTIVNQNLAFKSGFQPCSTIKLVVALAGLNEGLIDRNTLVPIGRRSSLDLTNAIAHSNNSYFASIGMRLGFDKVSHYAKLYGLGEKACINCPEEQPGTLPESAPAEGLGMMTSFGSGINLTPLQLASLVTAVANGGTLYHLQHPRTQQEVDQFQPKAKRQLQIAQWIPEVKPGMEGAVEYGTARRASYNPNEPIFGKTGTCSDVRSPGVHLGWFGSFNETGNKKLVVVVLLTGGRPINGPVASGVAGSVYRNLSEEGYFGAAQVTSASLQTVSSQVE